MFLLRGLAVVSALSVLVGCGDDDKDDKKQEGPTDIVMGGITTATSGGSAHLLGANVGQGDFLEHEINTAGGLLDGRKVDFDMRDGENDKTVAAAQATELLQREAKAIVGAGGSGVTMAALAPVIAADVPFAGFFGTNEKMEGCTEAKLADNNVTKETEPVREDGKCWNHEGLFFRTSVNSGAWAKTIGDYLNNYEDPPNTYPFRNVNAASITIDPDDISNPEPEPGDLAIIAAVNGTHVGTVGFKEDTYDDDDWRNMVRDLFDTTRGRVTAKPRFVTMSARVGSFKSFAAAYQYVRDEVGSPIPTGADAPTFVTWSSIKDSYASLSADALAAIAGERNHIGIQPGPDVAGTGYTKWLAAYEAYDPSGEFVHHTQPRFYDAGFILAAAMLAANSLVGTEIAAKIREVSNPPGTVIYPGEFAKARSALLAGDDIDYQGGSGNVDIDFRGEIGATGLYDVWYVKTDGEPETKEIITSAE